MITTIRSCGWSTSTSTCLIVAVWIGGAVTIATRSVTWESVSVGARMASTTLRRMSCCRAVGVAIARPILGAGGPDLGLGVADDLLARLLGQRVDRRDSVGDLAHGRAHHQLLLGEAHAAELDAQARERLRPARGLGLGARHLGHHPQPVEDLARQTDGLRELLIDVD